MDGDGVMFCMAECFTCGNMMSFNPDTVPAVRDARQVKQPVCYNCIQRANPVRVAKGLPPIEILPGTYAGQRGN